MASYHLKPMPAETEAALLAVVKAARALLGKLDDAMPHIESAILIATVHHCPYRGPALDSEADALRTAFTNLDRLNP